MRPARRRLQVCSASWSAARRAARSRTQPVRGQAAAAWALVHGFTMLAIDGQLLPEKVGAKPIDAVLTSMLEGLES